MKNITRTIVLSAAALVTVGSLTACSTGTSTPTATTTVTATPAPAAPLDRTDGNAGEQALVAAYESEFGSIDTATETELVSLGYTVCESFDSGLSFWDIGQIGIDSGMPEYETGFIIGASVSAFCPEYTQDIIDAADAAGVDTGTDTY